MKRAAIRRLGAWAIILSNDSVRTLLVSEKKFEEFFPLPGSKEDIIVNREDVLCPRLSGKNQSMTGLCWDRFIDKGQAEDLPIAPSLEFSPVGCYWIQ